MWKAAAVAGDGLKWRVNRAVRASRLMPAPARLIMFVLSDRADSTTAEIPETRTPSLAELAQETGLGESTVKRHLPPLERYGWVTRSRPNAEERARHKSTGYRLAVGSEGSTGSEGPEWAVDKSDSRAQNGPSPRARSGPSQKPPRAQNGPSEDSPRAQSGPTEGPERAHARAQSETSSHIYDRNDQPDDQNRAATSAASSPEPTPAKPSKHETADALAAKFWEIHKSATAQPFLAIRGVIRTAISNGIERDDVARALDRLAKEGRPISGGSITVALSQIRAGAVMPFNGTAGPGYPPRPSTTDQRVAVGLGLADYYRSRGE